MKHTPGPWRIGSYSGRAYGHQILSADDGPETSIALIDYWPVSMNNEGKANAKLIAASPTLFRAGKGMIDALAVFDWDEIEPSIQRAFNELKLAVKEAGG